MSGSWSKAGNGSATDVGSPESIASQSIAGGDEVVEAGNDGEEPSAGEGVNRLMDSGGQPRTASSDGTVQTGGRIMDLSDIRKAIESSSKDARFLAAVAAPDIKGRRIPYDKGQLIGIFRALLKLADIQGDDFFGQRLGPDGIDYFGPERAMLLRAILGHGDRHTYEWFVHEIAEVTGVSRRGGRGLSGNAYLELQYDVHHELVSKGITASYHPLVKLAFPEQFGIQNE